MALLLLQIMKCNKLQCCAMEIKLPAIARSHGYLLPALLCSKRSVRPATNQSLQTQAAADQS